MEEIQATLDSGIWSPALAAALVVPDACGAIEFPERRIGERYKAWYDAYVEPFGLQLSSGGALVWKIRNAMIHEAGVRFDAFGFDRVLFTVPNRNANFFDQNIMRMGDPDAPWTLKLDLCSFVRRISQGAERWIEAITHEADKQERLERLLQFRPLGLAPYIIGAPLIA